MERDVNRLSGLVTPLLRIRSCVELSMGTFLAAIVSVALRQAIVETRQIIA